MSNFKQQLVKRAGIAALLCLVVFLCVSQGAGQEKSPMSQGAPSAQSAVPKPAATASEQTALSKQEFPGTKQLEKYPGLMDEFARLLGRWQTEVQIPPGRRQSRLLPLLPASTAFYVAIPNYGESDHQALQIFRQELEQSAVLNEWWHKEGGKDGSKVEDAMEKFYQLSQYLGDEIVLSSPVSDKQNHVLILAEIKKPGLRAALQQLAKSLGDKSNSLLPIYTPKQLAAAKQPHAGEPVALLRPDLLAVAFDISVLRDLNAHISQGGGGFASVPFGQRLGQAYQGGTRVLMGADLQQVLSKLPMDNAKDQAAFRISGFADLKYAVSESREEAPGQPAGQTELSFTGPRRGVASWLASSGPLNGLDFVSPTATMVGAFRLKSPALIFDDITDLVNAIHPGGLAGLTQMEQGLNISLRDDVLRKLTGEIILAMEGTGASEPRGTLLLGVNDPDGLQQTLSRILAAVGMKAMPLTEGGLTSYSILIPDPKKPVEIDYAFAGGYLLIAPSREILAENLRIHASGGSLSKSQEFRSSLPGGPSSEASALIYQDFGPAMKAFAKQAQPELARLLGQLKGDGKPATVRLTANETSIRAASSNSRFDVATVLIVAAIAIPNLLRSRMMANESAAAGTMRTINTAQVTYAVSYPARGYAASLAVLGPGHGDCSSTGGVSEANACLLDSELGGAACASGKWCTKGAFRYSVSAICKNRLCRDYVAVATPVDESHGTKSFCSVSDAVIRFKAGPPLSSPVTISECRSWSPAH